MPTKTDNKNNVGKTTTNTNSDAPKRGPSTADRRAAEAREIAASMPDRVIDARTVYMMINSKCKTGHVALRLAAAGKITAIRLSSKTVRYSEKSVLAYLSSLGLRVGVQS